MIKCLVSKGIVLCSTTDIFDSSEQETIYNWLNNKNYEYIVLLKSEEDIPKYFPQFKSINEIRTRLNNREELVQITLKE